jgi:uncharacterized membrane protein
VGRLRTYFLTGLILVAPLVLTVYVVRSMIGWVDGLIKPNLPSTMNPDTYLPFALPGIGLIIALFMITLIGFLTANFVGRKIVQSGEKMLARMPVVRSIYSGLKQIFETVFSDKSQSFKSVALIEYPRKGVWALAFVAGDTQGEVRERLMPEADETIAVFMATTPNPTGGFVMFFPKKDIKILKMSVEDCLKLVISTGLVWPHYNQETIQTLATREGIELPKPRAPRKKPQCPTLRRYNHICGLGA